MILKQILFPLSTEDFAEKFWPNNHLVIHDDLERWDSLFNLKEIMDLEKVLHLYKNVVMVVGKPIIEASEGISDRFLVTPEKALEWYDRGAALELDFMDMWLPKASRTLEKLKRELSLIDGTSTKLVMYAAKNGGGFKAHFDAYANFVFQLKGKKTWKVLENSNVINPTQHYDLAESPYLPEELSVQWTGEFPDETIVDAEIVQLIPGSLLFLPRGYWHATESNDETLSLNITISQPTWLDLLLAEIRLKLVRENSWRELINEKDLNTVSGMISGSLKKLNEIQPLDLLKRGKEELDLYQQTQYVFRQTLRL